MSDLPTASLDDILKALVAIRDLLTDLGRPPAALIDRDEFAALLGIGTSTFDKFRAACLVGPQPFSPGGPGGSLRWHRAEVECWLRNRDHRGELFDERSWPGVWQALQKQHQRSR